ncbi:MAG: hypothetical protein H7178_03115 [Chitinophagaceae bacterium]|nr:hypothetical protein [Chitinophagaceae bacterium]
MRQLVLLFLFLTIVFCGSIRAQKKQTNTSKEEMRSPVNQVFQFMYSGTCNSWADSSKTNATLYLWVPENCKKLRGILILCTNVPEHMLVGHLAIRKACEDNNLGIIWGTPSFMNFRKNVRNGKTLNMALEHKTTVDFLQQMLDGLAENSGYKEVASVPWLPMGESGHLLMVDALMEYKPERCIAGVFIKNNHLPSKNREVPTLVAYGSAQEWGQDLVDIRTRWNDIGAAYDGVLNERKKNPQWPLSYIIDGSSGHFDCSEKLVKYFANYIGLVAKARLSSDGNTTLKSINLSKGFLADMPVPGHENHSVVAYSDAKPTAKALPWFFDKASALEAQSFAAINWKAATQIPAFLNDSGKAAPFIFNGISKLIPSDLGDDGMTFTVKPVLLDKIPDNFKIGAGEKLAKSSSTPVLEWVSGQFKPIGNNRFRISLDRSWPNTANYIGVRQQGNDTIRSIFQPCGLTLPKNNSGKPQKIIFEKIPDVKVATKSIQLVANSDAGLPVEFYVLAGPAIIENGKIIFTKIPPSSKFPVKVTVVAYQWGRNKETQIRTATNVEQIFYITQ